MKRHRAITTALIASAATLAACQGPRQNSAPDTTDPTDPPTATTTPPNTPIAPVAEAQRLAEAGLDDAALDLLAQAIETNPTLTTAHLAMGDIYASRGDFTAAEQSFSNAAQLQPTNFDAQYNHGFSLHMLARLSEAVRAYLRALAIRPEDFQANLNVATAYLELGEPRQAQAFAERAATIDPQSGPARANLGATLAKLAEDNATRADTETARNQYEQAIRQFQAALEYMDPTPELLLNLATALGRVERFLEMEATLNTLIEIQPSAPAYERLGFARFRQNNLNAAEQAFSQAINLDPRHFPAINGLAVCRLNAYHDSQFTDRDAHAEALRLLRQSLSVNARQPRITQLIERYSNT